MLRLLKLLVIVVWLTPPSTLAEESKEPWLVVVHSNTGLSKLSKQQVKGLFLGRSLFLPSGKRVKVFDFPVNSEARADFYRILTGKNIADIDAYWARIRYSGRASPPQALDSADEIIQAVQNIEGAVAYLPASFKDSLKEHGLTAVLIMEP